jgi:signal peptidase I
MVVFRSAIADYNVVPSGSMLPTVMVGDRILVDKLAYDLRLPLTHISLARLGEPRRGDIVTIDSRQAGNCCSSASSACLATWWSCATTCSPSMARRPATARRSTARGGDGVDQAVYRDERIDGMNHLVRLSESHPSLHSSFGPVVVPAGSLPDAGRQSRQQHGFPLFRLLCAQRADGALQPHRFLAGRGQGYQPRSGSFRPFAGPGRGQ